MRTFSTTIGKSVRSKHRVSFSMRVNKIRVRPATFAHQAQRSQYLKECVSIRNCVKMENGSELQKSQANTLTRDSNNKFETSDCEVKHQRVWSVNRSRDCESKLRSALYVRKLPETKSPFKIPNSQKYFNRFED